MLIRHTFLGILRRMPRDARVEPAPRPQVSSQALAALAGRQHGLVSHSQLLALGFSSSAIARMLAAGRLHRLHRGVYAVGHGALLPRARWMGATLAGGEGARLSHKPAGSLWELLPVGGGRIDITVPSTTGRGVPGLRVHTRELAPQDGAVVDGIPCTSLARTLLDLACVLPPDRLLEACERSVQLKLFDLVPLAELLDRCRGHRGTRRLNVALAQLTDDPDLLRSELERRLRALLASSSVIRPRTNFHVNGKTGRLHECDAVWPRQGLIVEADGRAYHSTRAALQRDARKQRDLEAAGWRVLRFGWGDVVYCPAATAARVTRELSSLSELNSRVAT